MKKKKNITTKDEKIKKNSRLKKKAQNQESRFKVQDLKNQEKA